jgi:hypothetical protein
MGPIRNPNWSTSGIVMGEAYPYMDLNAKYKKLTTMLNTTIDPNKDISKTRQVHVK